MTTLGRWPLRGMAAGLALWMGAAFAGERYRTPFLKAPVPIPAPGETAAAAAARNLPEPLSREEFSQSPFSMMGKLTFRSGAFIYDGSATLVRPKVALTAGHNLWDPRDGWSVGVRFDRAKYGGEEASSTPAREIYLYSSRYMDFASRNPSSARAFAWDVGWVVFSRRPARGKAAPMSAAAGKLRGAREWRAMGYGQDFHSGALPLSVAPTAGFRRVRGAYFENATYGTEGGMSGGPVFVKSGTRWVVVAVVVSGYADYSASGVRALEPGLVRALKFAR